jgi:hypothetical protein
LSTARKKGVMAAFLKKAKEEKLKIEKEEAAAKKELEKKKMPVKISSERKKRVMAAF